MRLTRDDGVSNSQYSREWEQGPSFVDLWSPRFFAKDLALDAKGFHELSVIEERSEQTLSSFGMTIGENAQNQNVDAIRISLRWLSYSVECTSNQ